MKKDTLKILTLVDPTKKGIQNKADEMGVDLEAVVICFKMAGELTITNRAFPIVGDDNSVAAVLKAVESAELKFDSNNKDKKEMIRKGGVLYSKDAETFFSDRTEAGAGTGCYLPIVHLMRHSWGLVVPDEISAYLGIGIAGGTKEQNREIILSTVPIILKSIKATDSSFSLPRVLINAVKTASE